MNSVFRSAAPWLAFCVAVPVFAAASEAPGIVAPKFESLDRNADDRLSRTEAGYNRMLLGIFVTSDVDGDGFVSRVEYERAVNNGEIVARFTQPGSARSE